MIALASEPRRAAVAVNVDRFHADVHQAVMIELAQIGLRIYSSSNKSTLPQLKSEQAALWAWLTRNVKPRKG